MVNVVRTINYLKNQQQGNDCQVKGATRSHMDKVLAILSHI